MTAHFGHTDLTAGTESARLRIVFSEGPLELRWLHCSMTADFIADLFAGLAVSAELDRANVRHSIGYLANELLENAVKFRAPGDVVVEAALDGTEFTIVISNFATPEMARGLEELIQEFTSRDPSELLLERMERNAEDPESTGSGLGLLTLANDYGVRLGWTLQPPAAGAPVHVRTIAAITLT
jgi:hypothetical protein